jgi:hypothetical protein
MMTDPAANGSSSGDKLRDLENDRSAQRHAGQGDGLEGLREISRAWYENRSTEYLLRKAWADPINRWFFILVVLGIAAIWAFLLAQ